jgi:predicted PurR-regulated permease PerM
VIVDKEIQIPFYAKATIFLIGLLAFFAILYIAQEIIVPLVFSVIIAIVLHPIVNFFVRKKVNRIVAIVITLLLTFIIISAFVALLYSQASMFSESWPLLVEKSSGIINQSIVKASGYLDLTPQIIHEWLSNTQRELINTGSSALGETLLTVGSGLVVLFLIPVYVFIILFYHPLLIEFIHRLFHSHDPLKINTIVTQIKTVIQRYLVGLVIEAVIVAAMNSIGLLLLGIEYAILLGIIGALLNVIPYIGGIIAVALPMMVALATKTTAWPALYVLMLYMFVQLVDNNYLIPKIVSSKVKINALFSIIVVISGNTLWGISGMFLSIPLLAIVKLIFDQIDPLKPWGFLLGDTMPPLIKIKSIFKKSRSRA